MMQMFGCIQLFNPSSTTYVKHFISNCKMMVTFNLDIFSFCAGYGNTTSAINAVDLRCLVVTLMMAQS
jgi:hypothetical protein